MKQRHSHRLGPRLLKFDPADALHCGRSDAVVFDVDRPDRLSDVLRRHLNGDVPYQATRPGTSGRGHYVFTQPPGRSIGNGTGKLGGDWGEVRGLNGVIIVRPRERRGRPPTRLLHACR